MSDDSLVSGFGLGFLSFFLFFLSFFFFDAIFSLMAQW